jgi:peptidoglycan/xylan/chitin deacetylase (PgdA/CDA1 family)
VLTFDDGWFGCLDGAFVKLKALGWPATLYVTTYYSVAFAAGGNRAACGRAWQFVGTLRL